MSNHENTNNWLLWRLRRRGPLSTSELTDLRGCNREHMVHTLTELERSQLIAYDPSTDKFQLTEKAEMRFRRKQKTRMNELQNDSAKPAPVASLEAEKDRLILEFSGPHGLMQAAVEDDPILHERLAVAIAQGMPAIDLLSVSRYKRPLMVEEALDAWRARTTGGPCGWCGSRTARRSPRSVSIHTEAVDDGWAEHHGVKACAWCSYMLQDHTVAEFRDMVYNAVAGVWGIPVVGHYRSWPELVPFAHEIKGSPTPIAGPPWFWLAQPDWQEAILLDAKKVVHRSRFVRHEGQRQMVAVPGITTPIHSVEDLPQPEKKFMRPPLHVQIQEAEREQARRQKEDAAAKHAADQQRQARERAEKRAKDEHEREMAEARALVLRGIELGVIDPKKGVV